jgi:hypothetical protein
MNHHMSIYYKIIIFERELKFKITKYLYMNVDHYLRRVLNNMIFECYRKNISLVEMLKSKTHVDVIENTPFLDKNKIENFHSGLISIIKPHGYLSRYDVICQELKRGPIELDIQKNIVYEMIMLEIKDDINIVENMLNNMFTETNINYYKNFDQWADYAPIINIITLAGVFYGIYKICSIFNLR